MAHNARHFTEMLDGQGGAWWYFLDKARIHCNELIYMPFAWLLFQFWKKQADRNLLALLVWIGLPYLFFSFAKTKMPGYVLLSAPAVFVLAACFLENFRWARVPISGAILRVAFVVLALRYGYERVKPLQDQSQAAATKSKILELPKRCRPGEKTVVANCPVAMQVMFLTDLTAYELITAPQRTQLEAAGWWLLDWNEH